MKKFSKNKNYFLKLESSLQVLVLKSPHNLERRLECAKYSRT